MSPDWHAMANDPEGYDAQMAGLEANEEAARHGMDPAAHDAARMELRAYRRLCDGLARERIGMVE